MSAQLQDQVTTIGVRRVAGNIGALITGADLAKPLDPQVVAEGKPFLRDADVQVA